jgi:hypothetical protein
MRFLSPVHAGTLEDEVNSKFIERGFKMFAVVSGTSFLK